MDVCGRANVRCGIVAGQGMAWHGDGVVPFFLSVGLYDDGLDSIGLFGGGGGYVVYVMLLRNAVVSTPDDHVIWNGQGSVCVC